MTQDEYVHLAERLAQEWHGQRISTYATLCTTPYPSEIERSDSKLSLATSSLSWATPCQTVVILDWDDTLFPTAWLRGRDWFEAWLDSRWDPGEMGGADRALLAELDGTAQSFMAAAGCLGQLCIVTLAKRPWQAWSMQAFYPGLAKSWEALGVKVRYAREERVVGASVHSMMVGRRSDPETDAEQYVREQGTYARLKMKSMQGFLKKLYQERSWKNVVSIGDGPAERQALQELGLGHINPTSTKSGRQKELRIKTVQMAMEPSCEQLCGELQVLASWLPALVNLDADFDVDLNRSEEDLFDVQGQMADLLERGLCGTL